MGTENIYKSEVIFGLVLVALVALSTWLSWYIPENIYDNVLTPAMNVCTFAVAFTGAWIIYRHSEGMRMRRLWGHALMLWGIGDLAYWVCYIIAPMSVMNMGAARLTTYELLLGNLLGWMMVLYPMETLRPGWLSGKTAVWQLLPMALMVLLDYFVPLDLWPVIALYPYALLIMVLTHIRAYRKWCENNYSSMEHIDVQWIIRYCIMLFIVGANYMYINASHDHTRAFTQQWFVIFMLAYSTEQILFRKDPWTGVNEVVNEDNPTLDDDTNRMKLEQWMETEKPYRNPDFKLMDVRAALPMNRTYLSEFINTTYGCSFYQFVNRHRIEEAKRLMKEHPEMKIADVATCSGFSSRAVFSRVFSKETGMSPREWEKLYNT